MGNVNGIRSEDFSVKKGLYSDRISVVKYKSRNPVPIKWVFKSKEEAGGLINLK